jgi:carbon monoxide dehydrogenase subunit G
MLIDEKFRVGAPVDKAWQFILDPAKMGPCVPGFVSATETEPDVWDLVMKVKVGIISLKMHAHMKVVEKTPPKHMKASGDGHDTLRAGTFHQETEVDLVPVGENETEIHYTMNVRMVGKLATFGEKIMRATAGKMGGEIAENIRKAIEAKP